jgi:hypothetical protein
VAASLQPKVAMRVIADITDPDVIQEIPDHIAAQTPLIKRVTASQL